MGYTRPGCLLLAFATGLRTAAAGTYYLADPNSCQIVGDPDLYGIGVRVGLYLQWLSLFLALVFAPDEAIPALTASNIITLAVFISFLVGINADSLIFVDFPIVVCLTFILSIGLVTSALFTYKDNTRAEIMACTLFFMYSCPIYMLPWVAFKAYDYGHRPNCRLRNAILIYWFDGWGSEKKANLKEGAHQGLQNLAIFLTLVWTGLLLVLFLAIFGLHFAKPSDRSSAADATSVTSASSAQAKANEDRVQARFFKGMSGLCIAAGTCCAIYVVAQVEQGIRKNEIDLSAATWSNTGQLIPLLSGVFNVCVVSWRGSQTGRPARFLVGTGGCILDLIKLIASAQRRRRLWKTMFTTLLRNHL
ncbi:MAG: hypothetical protein LQ352_006836 [Teloschistes flavicans]|nr:MAG: hypothetical protein LQ352_006836 [Teloschistes flavicans]